MKNIDWFMVVVFVLFMGIGFTFGVEFEQQREHDRVAAYVVAPATAPVDIQVYDDLKELDKRDQQIAKRINEMNKQIGELYGRTDYLRDILQQVIDVIQGTVSEPTPAPQGNAL